MTKLQQTPQTKLFLLPNLQIRKSESRWTFLLHIYESHMAPTQPDTQEPTSLPKPAGKKQSKTGR